MRCLIVLLLSLTVTFGQLPSPSLPDRRPTRPEERRLPNGTLQSEAIIKAEHDKSLQDVREMKKLILDFAEEFEKSDRNVVSVQTIRKLEEIEKRAKRIRTRLTRP
jgi:hypothetical protein